MEKPSCGAAKAVVSGGETFYECSDSDSPCYQNLCNADMCFSDNHNSTRSNADCIHKDYYGICQNDNSYNHGDYCHGHCGDFESK